MPDGVVRRCVSGGGESQGSRRPEQSLKRRINFVSTTGVTSGHLYCRNEFSIQSSLRVVDGTSHSVSTPARAFRRVGVKLDITVPMHGSETMLHRRKYRGCSCFQYVIDGIDTGFPQATTDQTLRRLPTCNRIIFVSLACIIIAITMHASLGIRTFFGSSR